MNAWIIPKSKGCSELVQLAGDKTTFMFLRKFVSLEEVSGTLIRQKQDFFIFNTDMHI
jgi:hypothetical protein